MKPYKILVSVVLLMDAGVIIADFLPFKIVRFLRILVLPMFMLQIYASVRIHQGLKTMTTQTKYSLIGLGAPLIAQQSDGNAAGDTKLGM